MLLVVFIFLCRLSAIKGKLARILALDINSVVMKQQLDICSDNIHFIQLRIIAIICDSIFPKTCYTSFKFHFRIIDLVTDT